MFVLFLSRVATTDLAPDPEAHQAESAELLAVGPPPRGELFADPRLRVVWAAIEQLDEGDRHVLLDELGEHVALHTDRSGRDGRRRAKGIAHVRASAEI